MIFRFCSGSSTPSSRVEEPLLRLDVDERHVEVLAERLDDLLRLRLAQEAVVDEDARELVADRLVHEQRGDRRVDAARERAEDALRADLGADPLDLLLDHRRGRPGGRRAGDVVEEVLQDLHPARRVHDLRVELDAVELPLRRLERGDRRRRRAGDDPRALGRRDHGVAVRHPDRLLVRDVVEERALLGAQLRLAELGDARSGRRGRRARAPSAACRSRCRASGCRARRGPGRRAARRPRTPTRGRRSGSARTGCGRARPPARSCARRAPSRPGTRARGARSAASTARRGR